MGLVAEVVSGELVVEFQLAPGLVMAHFLLGMVFLADAVVLHQRAGLPDQAGPTPASPATGPSEGMAGRPCALAARPVQLAAAVVAIALGTIVTSTGPHGGRPTRPEFRFSLHSVAQLHGTSVEVLLAVTC